jgi:hypothetical protein
MGTIVSRRWLGAAVGALLGAALVHPAPVVAGTIGFRVTASVTTSRGSRDGRLTNTGDEAAQRHAGLVLGDGGRAASGSVVQPNAPRNWDPVQAKTCDGSYVAVTRLQYEDAAYPSVLTCRLTSARRRARQRRLALSVWRRAAPRKFALKIPSRAAASTRCALSRRERRSPENRRRGRWPACGDHCACATETLAATTGLVLMTSLDETPRKPMVRA